MLPIVRRASFAVLVALALAAQASTASAQTYFPENATPVNYVVPPMNAHCLHNYRLFLPRPPHVKPPGGWPVVLHMKYNGYRRSEDTPSLPQDSLMGQLLDAGVAVIAARATPSILLNDPLWTEWCGVPPVLPGHGLFHPPGYVPPDLSASGIRPYDNPNYHMAEKDVVMLVQHVRYMARQDPAGLTGFAAKMADLDHLRIGLHGTSAGAMIAMWAALGIDHRNELPFVGLGGQYNEPTRVDFAVLEKGVVWWPLFSDLLDPPTMHFGAAGHSEIASPVLGDADPWEMLYASPLYYEDRASNATLPVYMSYGEPSVSEVYDKKFIGCGLLPFCFDNQGLEGVVSSSIDFENYHPAWSGYTWLRNHTAAPIRLAITGEEAYEQRGPIANAIPLYGDPLTQTPQEILEMQQADIVNWVSATLDDLLAAIPPEVWTPVGSGLAGTQGVPQLQGEGQLFGNEWVSLHVQGGRPQTQVHAIAGFHAIHAPLLGGVLVPSPDVIIMSAAHTDSQGKATLTALWPPGLPGGQEIVFQMWLSDPLAPQGFSATPGLSTVVP